MGTELPEPKTKTKRDWTLIRREYEATKISQRDLADKHGISRSTLMQRAMREKWSQKANLVRQAASRLEAELNDKAVAIVRDELAPFIEAKKVEITRRGYKVGDRGLSRIEKLWRGVKPESAKDEADAARAAETFLRMARTSLGMGDNTGAIGNLNVQILTNQAQIAVATQ